jgi:hypothetical protein
MRSKIRDERLAGKGGAKSTWRGAALARGRDLATFVTERLQPKRVLNKRLSRVTQRVAITQRSLGERY